MVGERGPNTRAILFIQFDEQENMHDLYMLITFKFFDGFFCFQSLELGMDR